MNKVIRMLLLQSGFTVSPLGRGRVVKLSPSTVWEYLSGGYPKIKNPKQLEKIVHALGISPEELLRLTRLSDDEITPERADPVSGCTQGVSFSLSPSTTQWSYQFYINSSVKKVRGAIAWNAFQGGPSYYLNDIVDDINLVVLGPDGRVITSSASYDNAYEIVDFDPTVTGYYTVKVTLNHSYTNQTVPVRLCMIHYTQ